MEERTVARLGDVLSIVNGKNQKAVENPNGKYPIYGSGGIMGRADEYICDADTVIIGRKGNINNPIFVAEPFWNVDTAFGLVCDQQRLLPRYLYHFCCFYDFEKLNSTVTIPSLTKKNLGKIEIPLPSLIEQHHIAQLLDAVLTQITNAKQMLTKADELIQSRFVEMFGSQPMSALSDFCDFYSGGTPSKKNPEYWDGSLPWFSPKDIKSPMLWDSIDHVNDRITEKTNLKIIPEDTVVVVVRGMILAHDVPVAIVKTAATINQDLKAMIPKRECNAVFLASALRNQEKMLLAETGQSAHGTKKLDTDVLGSVAVPNVPLALQNEFAEFVTQVESLKSATRQQLDRLNTLYDSLAQRYFAE